MKTMWILPMFKLTLNEQNVIWISFVLHNRKVLEMIFMQWMYVLHKRGQWYSIIDEMRGGSSVYNFFSFVYLFLLQKQCYQLFNTHTHTKITEISQILFYYHVFFSIFPQRQAFCDSLPFSINLYYKLELRTFLTLNLIRVDDGSYMIIDHWPSLTKMWF